MLDIIAFLKNTALVIGTKKADDAVDGAAITREVIGQIQKFTKDQKKTNEIKTGPLKHFLQEMFEGIYIDKPENLVPDLIQWIAEVKSRGENKTKPINDGNRGNFKSK